MERSDRGDYQCVATNNVGPPVNMTVPLTVRCQQYDDDDDDDNSRYGPRISVPRPRVQQALGYDVVMQCTVDR